MPTRLLAVLAAVVLAASALPACGEGDPSVERPRSTPELTLPGGDLTPEDGPGTTQPPTTTAPGATTGAETTPGAQGAAGTSELESFCQENPGAC